jgi:hypothetical protein
MRVALAVVSLLVLFGGGVVVYDQFFNRWEEAPDRLFSSGAGSLAKTPAERAAVEGPPKHRAEYRHAIRRFTRRPLPHLPPSPR